MPRPATQLPLPIQAETPEGDGVPREWRPIVAYCVKVRRKPRQLVLPLELGQLPLFDGH